LAQQEGEAREDESHVAYLAHRVWCKRLQYSAGR
jgi:hypothetical protein